MHEAHDEPGSGAATSGSARRGRSSPAAIERAERERHAIVLRREGRSYEEIADEVGYRDRSGAKKAVERGLGRWMREADEELRALELERLDRIGQLVWQLIESDDSNTRLSATETYLRLMNHRAKITGLYNVRTQRHEVVVSPPPSYTPPVLEEVRRFMVLTKQMTEENAAGIAPAELVESMSHLDDHDLEDLE
jgi:hypothetical protein